MILALSFKQIMPFLFIGAFIIIAFSAYFFSKKKVILRRLDKFQFRSISQFRTNEPTKIMGKVLQTHEPFVVPFSKRKCVAYEIKIEQKVSTGKSSKWKTLVVKEDIQDFFIEERGEVVMVKPTVSPKNYHSYLVKDKSVSSGTFNSPTPEFRKLLEDFNIKAEGLFGLNKTLRYSERILEVGETVIVAGVAKWKSLNQPLEGYSYSKIAALESTSEQKLFITDLPEARKERR
ncbi:hypothetical protein [Seonamhaeicola marinus]|uniref:RING-type E3 ubiquitin transferase n=1 Tax=Seonamhaeicola marinus TaxID=1912246 RepID=A0A5D0HU65_9FLAO|nr:hypothetical protein [Seonamhaeicola marinus]TYA74450.1 hypothetical protein FUA24_14090 [Seonamhaeicola marinus]